MRTDIKYNYRAYRSLPENGKRYQLVAGELLVSPSPKTRHQVILRRLTMALTEMVEKKRWGQVYFAPLDVVLSDEDVVQPDLFYVSKARASIVREEGVFGGPDLCVEILSPSTCELDREAKRTLYARHGVLEYWIVDPDADVLQVFRLQEDAERAVKTLGAKDTLTSALFEGFAAELGGVFAR
ncbi:MAG: Uma2 family endonuclease [Planctomycetes bacterium]|nr:Uma2 family endonuclease [Planctomycetota bacterium]